MESKHFVRFSLTLLSSLFQKQNTSLLRISEARPYHFGRAFFISHRKDEYS